MPLGDLASEVFGGVIRFLGQILGQIVAEILIRGPGYFICRIFDKHIDSESIWVFLAGVLFWIFVGFGGHYVYAQITESIAVDRCLDSGGAFNKETRQCVHS
jgi:hypothetical protein